jgi:ABC-type sugar transport system ATPase subunit
VVRFAGCEVTLPRDSPLREAAGRHIVLGVRPHDLALARPDADTDQPVIEARIDVVERLGTETQLVFTVDAPRVEADELREAMDQGDDDTADALLGAGDRAQFTAAIEPRAAVAAHDVVELTVDPRRLYGFDASTGQAIGTPAAAGDQRAVERT